MLWKSSAFLPQVSGDGYYQRQASWLAGPPQLCVIFISQNQTRVVHRSQMAFILMGLNGGINSYSSKKIITNIKVLLIEI